MSEVNDAGLINNPIADVRIQNLFSGNVRLVEGGGRVGIGGAPTGSYKLDVMAAAAAIRLASSSGNSLSSFDFVAGTANATIQLWGQTAAGTIGGVTAATALDLAAVGGPLFLRTTTAQNMYLLTNGTLRLEITAAGNVALFATGSYGSGTLVLFVANASANPSANPTGGGILYSNGGAGTWRGSGGTVTAFGPA